MKDSSEPDKTMPTDLAGADAGDHDKRLEALLTLVQKDDPRDAVYACDAFNRDYPESGQGWSVACQLALRINDPAAAVRAVELALRTDPERPEWLLQKANCLPLVGRVDEARTIAGEMAKRLFPTAGMSSSVGLLLSRLGMHEESVPLFRDAIKQDPQNGGHYYNLGASLRFLGALDDAEKNLDKAIELNPRDADAMLLRSGLRKQSAEANHVDELKTALEQEGQSPRYRVTVCYAAARELDDLDACRDSFDMLARGAAIRREHTEYNVQPDLDVMAQIRETFDDARLSRDDEGHIDIRPIFVFGMPRTGTTLVERILGSHSVVNPAGELTNFAVQLTNQVRASAESRIGSLADFVKAAAKLDFTRLGNAYVESCSNATEGHAHFVDKMPLNFLYAGLIHLALPKAKIVHLRRDPMDTCYAVFKTLFEGAYPFSYDLEELARYYAAYHRLMEHWEDALPGVMLHVRYEDLVDEPEKQINRLLDYCSLSREAQCLEFHRHNKASTTASAAQIRQPIYKSSVGSWRRYENELRPVADILREAGIEINASR